MDGRRAQEKGKQCNKREGRGKEYKEQESLTIPTFCKPVDKENYSYFASDNVKQYN